MVLSVLYNYRSFAHGLEGLRVIGSYANGKNLTGKRAHNGLPTTPSRPVVQWAISQSVFHRTVMK